jgi:hypothetical protein
MLERTQNHWGSELGNVTFTNRHQFTPPEEEKGEGDTYSVGPFRKNKPQPLDIH